VIPRDPHHSSGGIADGGSRPARVLVVGAGTVAELAVIRGLRSAGYEPWIVTWNRRGIADRSRSACGVVRVPPPSKEPQRLARLVPDWARRLEATAVLPGTEAALLVLSETADHFAPEVALGGASSAAVRRATDKWAVNEAAGRAGVGLPPTVRVNGGIPAVDMSYPAVLKPVRSEHRASDGALRHFDARRLATENELRAALARLPEGGLVQPYLRAPMRTLNGLIWEGELVAAVHQWADRIWPPDCGVLSAARTVPRDVELERRVARLLADLGWSGMFNLQFLLNDGEPLLIDFNPRPYHSLALAIAAGANLPAIWVDLLLGRRPAVRDYEVGVRWRYLRHDALALWAAARSGRWRSVAPGLIPRPGTVHAVASWHDPGPMAWLVWRDVTELLR
jgi:predicted ATP-grasp superfamily ATP-dependent carboligase